MEDLQRIQTTRREEIGQAVARIQGQIEQLTKDRQQLEQSLANTQELAERAKTSVQALDIAGPERHYSAAGNRDRDTARNLHNRAVQSAKDIQQRIRENQKTLDERQAELDVLKKFLKWPEQR